MLNFWQFNAQLQAKGYLEIISMSDIISALGIDHPPPLLGWVFHDRWAASHLQAAKALLDTSFDAKQRLLQSDATWQKLRPMMKAPDDKLFDALKSGYRAGIPTGYRQSDIDAASDTLKVIIATDPTAAGGLSDLPPGTFWDGYRR
jgi:NitT/TauT family transport system substrate-binding protein